jgi:hypothetical protein
MGNETFCVPTNQRVTDFNLAQRPRSKETERERERKRERERECVCTYVCDRESDKKKGEQVVSEQ